MSSPAGRRYVDAIDFAHCAWYNKSKTSVCACFGHGSRLPPIAAAQSMQPENEFPVAWRIQCLRAQAFYGVPSQTAHAHYTIKRETLYGIWTADAREIEVCEDQYVIYYETW